MRNNRWILFPLVMLAAHLCGAQPGTNFIARLQPIPPFPALQAAAKARGIPLEGIDRAAGMGE